jgi:hypothetical protein
MPVRFPRVEQAFGVGSLLDSSDPDLWAGFIAAVAARLPEAADLDFKGTWYAGPKANEEFAKDCAAFANAGGGVIVCGVADHGRDVAAEITPIAEPAKVQDWASQTLAGRTAPKLPDVFVRFVPDPTNTAVGVVLVLVPRSGWAPHAVIYSKERFAYPLRRVSTTDWLTEAEVADSYRNRFRLAEGQVDRVEKVRSTGRRTLNRASACWLTLSMMPELPGFYRLSGQLVDKLESFVSDWASNRLKLETSRWGLSVHGRPRRGRVQLTQDPYQLLSSSFHAELYVDGAGFVAVQLGNVKGGSTAPYVEVSPYDVETQTLNLLDLLVNHAMDCGHSRRVIASVARRFAR